jgi:hypothetical protein
MTTDRLPFSRDNVKCGQKCGKTATVYAMDRLPGGWAGYYCEPCAKALNFQITDRFYTEAKV